MDLRRKIARLRGVTPNDAAEAPTVEAPVIEAPVIEAVIERAPDDLRARLRAAAAKTKRKRAKAEAARPVVEEVAWPFVTEESDGGVTQVATRTYDGDAKHGAVPLKRCLDVAGDHAATLSLDPSLSAFDARRALFRHRDHGALGLYGDPRVSHRNGLV